MKSRLEGTWEASGFMQTQTRAHNWVPKFFSLPLLEGKYPQVSDEKLTFWYPFEDQH